MFSVLFGFFQQCKIFRISDAYKNEFTLRSVFTRIQEITFRIILL